MCCKHVLITVLLPVHLKFLVRCSGHVHLGGDPRADLEQARRITSHGWPGNALAGEREVWVSLLRLQPLQPDSGRAVERGWMGGWMNRPVGQDCI